MPDQPAPSDPSARPDEPDHPRRLDLPPARWDLPENPSLEWLRKRAKEVKRRVAADDPQAVALLETYDPPVAESISLTRAQRVLARAFGFADWPALAARLRIVNELTRVMGDAPADEPVIDRFLRLACLDYATDGRARADAARALLREQPDLATATVATMAVCGRTADLEAALEADPAAVHAETGPFRWPPLLYLCYSRVVAETGGGVGDDVLGCLDALLAHGADPDAGFLWNGFPSPFTALTGAFGGGERSQPPHPQAVAIAERLLRAGADPNDNQTLYNRMFTPKDDHLVVLFDHGLGRPHPSPWRDRLGTAYPSPDEMVGEQLRSAAEYGYADRVRLLLDRGVDVGTTGYHPNLGDQTPHEIAVRTGNLAIARMLEEAGGGSPRIDDVDRWLGVVMSADAVAADAMLAEDPGLAARARERRPDAVAYAAERDHDGAIPLLLAHGFDVNATGMWDRTALHHAAVEGRSETVRLLLEAGADRSLRDGTYGGTPADWATHGGHQELADLLRE